MSEAKRTALRSFVKLGSRGCLYKHPARAYNATTNVRSGGPRISTRVLRKLLYRWLVIPVGADLYTITHKGMDFLGISPARQGEEGSTPVICDRKPTTLGLNPKV